MTAPRSKRALQVGDRVAVYDYEQGLAGTPAIVVETHPTYLKVEFSPPIMAQAIHRFFRAQCRRLIRRKREPARIWVRNKHLPGISLQVSGGLAVTCVDRMGDPEWTEFVEVRAPKRKAGQP
jgi:hypothetical protein